VEWFIFTLLCAWSFATSDVFLKKITRECAFGAYRIAWLRFVLSTPFLILLFPFIELPRIDPSFWLILLLVLPLEICATVFYVEALRRSPLSLTLPFLSLTPVFLLGTAFIILGERPNGGGTFGVLLVGLGGYLLNVHTIRDGPMAPIKAILQEKGSVFMIVCAALYSITACLGKAAALRSSPTFFSISYPILCSLALLPVVLIKEKGAVFSSPKRTIPLFLLMGLFLALMNIFHFLAITRIEASYMISVKRLHLIFGVIYGRVIFKEGYLKERLLGSVLMLTGVFLITL
jgi:drug/metabolite transporter (DMT)-like permease